MDETSETSKGGTRDLLEAFDEVSRLRSRLTEVHRRIERSAVDLFDLREERTRLEERLEAVFARAGAIIYDHHMRGEGFDLDVSFGEPLSDAATQEETEETCAEDVDDRSDESDLRASEEAGEVVVDTTGVASPSESPAEVQTVVESDEMSAEDGRAPTAAEKRAVERAPEPSSHQIYMRAARILPAVKRKLGSPPDKIESYPDAIEELGKLKRATQPKALGRWSQLPDEVQRCLIA